MKKVVLQARVETEYKDQLKKIAESYGLSVSSLLRLVVIGVVKSNGIILKDFISLAPNKTIYRKKP